MARRRLYPGQEMREIRIGVTDEQREQLRAVAATFGLEPAAYLRSLVATHLRRLKQEGTQ